MWLIVLLALMWLVLYVTLYAAVGIRLGRWLARYWAHRAGPAASVILALAALTGPVLALVGMAASVGGSPAGPSGLPASTASHGLQAMADFAQAQIWPFALGVLTSFCGNLLTGRSQ